MRDNASLNIGPADVDPYVDRFAGHKLAHPVSGRQIWVQFVTPSLKQAARFCDQDPRADEPHARVPRTTDARARLFLAKSRRKKERITRRPSRRREAARRCRFEPGCLSASTTSYSSLGASASRSRTSVRSSAPTAPSSPGNAGAQMDAEFHARKSQFVAGKQGPASDALAVDLGAVGASQDHE